MFWPRFWCSVQLIPVVLAGAVASTSVLTNQKLHAVELKKIDQVLADEAAGKPVNRRQVLANESDQDSQWQSGRVFVDGQWMDMESLQEHKLAPQITAYRQHRDSHDLDIEGHRSLAKWCENHQLPEMAIIHWKAVATTAVDDEEAHKALGHKKINQRWFSEEELARAAEEHQQQKSALKAWMPQVRKIVQQLRSNDSKAKLESLRKLDAIDAKDAIAALKFAAVQAEPTIALPIVAKIKSIRSKEACLALCEIALVDPTTDVGRCAVEGLREYDAHFYVPELLQMLEMPIEMKQQYLYLPNGSLVLHQAFVREGLTEKEQTEVVKLIAIQGPSNIRLHRSELGFTREEATAIRNVMGAFVTIKVPVNPQAAESLNKISEVELRRNRMETDIWDETRREMERHARAILSAISGLPANAAADQFWAWWPQLDETFQSYNKPVTQRYVQPANTYVQLPTGVTVNFMSCLVAGTPIQTSDGTQDVDKLKVGILVPSINVATGEVSLKPIVQVSSRTADAIYTISLDDGNAVSASGGHKWWVVGKGWLRSRELQAGQFIRTAGSSVEIKKVDKSDESTTVFNMVVDENHTYFVGKNRLLSWDVTSLQPTLLNAPGQSQTYVSSKK